MRIQRASLLLVADSLLVQYLDSQILVDLSRQQRHLGQILQGERGCVFPLVAVFLDLVDAGGIEFDHLAVDDSCLSENACRDWPTSELLFGLVHCDTLSRQIKSSLPY